jgi:hypothetical protein
MKNEKGFAQAKEVWDERFRREGFLFGEEPNQYLVSQAAKLTKGRALLVADGEGRNSVWLAKQGYTPKQLDYKTGGPGKLDHLYVESTIKEGFLGYNWLDFRLYEDELSEGAGHFGRSALLGAVGRKPISV